MKHLIPHRLLRVAFVAGALCATPALAAGDCSDGLATESIAVGNVSFEGAAAADCYGVVTGNLNSGKGAAGTITAVPEAKTYAMLLAGLGLIGFTVRRKLG